MSSALNSKITEPAAHKLNTASLIRAAPGSKLCPNAWRSVPCVSHFLSLLVTLVSLFLRKQFTNSQTNLENQDLFLHFSKTFKCLKCAKLLGHPLFKFLTGLESTLKAEGL